VTGPWASFAEALQSEARPLFRTGIPMSPSNERRFIAWCLKWERHTGQRPNLMAYVVQRVRGLCFPVQRLGARRLMVRTVGEPRR